MTNLFSITVKNALDILVVNKVPSYTERWCDFYLQVTGDHITGLKTDGKQVFTCILGIAYTEVPCRIAISAENARTLRAKLNKLGKKKPVSFRINQERTRLIVKAHWHGEEEIASSPVIKYANQEEATGDFPFGHVNETLAKIKEASTAEHLYIHMRDTGHLASCLKRCRLVVDKTNEQVTMETTKGELVFSVKDLVGRKYRETGRVTLKAKTKGELTKPARFQIAPVIRILPQFKRDVAMAVYNYPCLGLKSGKFDYHLLGIQNNPT